MVFSNFLQVASLFFYLLTHRKKLRRYFLVFIYLTVRHKTKGVNSLLIAPGLERILRKNKKIYN